MYLFVSGALIRVLEELKIKVIIFLLVCYLFILFATKKELDTQV